MNKPYIIAYTLAKNINAYKYPAELNVKQHLDLVDEWYFILPLKHQDQDDSWETIRALRDNADKGGYKIVCTFFDWPGDGGFAEESIDKTLQILFLKTLPIDHDYANTWLWKHDIDEFISAEDFETIKINMSYVADTEITNISTNYRQLVGSPYYYLDDPTKNVNHFFKAQIINQDLNFNYPGHDAMQVFTKGDNFYLDDVFTYHTGYIKSEILLTQKIKEHFKLNASVYKDLDSRIENYKWEWPEHKKGKTLWPLGIAPLRGVPNEAEYFKQNLSKLPLELREHAREHVYYMPKDI